MKTKLKILMTGIALSVMGIANAQTKTKNVIDDGYLRVASDNLTTPKFIPEDINKDGMVTARDLSILLLAYGRKCKSSCPSDINCDGVTNQKDLNMIISKFHYGYNPS